MAAQEFNCPKCGAPLDYPGSGATLRCPFCDTSVIVPAEIRGATDAPPLPSPIPTPVITIKRPEAVVTRAARRNTACLMSAILVGVILFVAAVIAIPIMLAARANKMSGEVVTKVSYVVPTMVPLATEVPVPTSIPTSSYASLVTTFGSSGIGPGLLNDARYIAVDGSGTVYVADYQDGRIQAFDPDGKYLHGWQVGNEKTILYGLAASHAGVVYVAYGGDIYRFDGSSGKALGKLDTTNGPEFGDLTTLPDGGVLGAWYEGRWGMITSLEGHRDDLVWFDADGKTVRRLESAISGQTGDLALETTLAVDGLGTVYALSGYDGAVFKFTSQGKFVDRFSVQGSDPSQSSQARCIAVDGQGLVYLGGSYLVSVYSPEGKFLQSFKTDSSVDMMAFSEQGDLYIVSRDTVSRYTVGK
jgi:DNA-binding beta-propeller fold protein YncE